MMLMTSESVRSSDERNMELMAFCYRASNGSVRQWADARIEIEKYLQPWSREAWTYEDVDTVYEQAVQTLREEYVGRRVPTALSRTFVLAAFREAALRFIAQTTDKGS